MSEAFARTCRGRLRAALSPPRPARPPAPSTTASSDSSPAMASPPPSPQQQQQQQIESMPSEAPVASQAGPSTPTLAPPQADSQPPIKNLILDAAPLLTLFPLRGLASRYLIAPQVLAEIRDRRAREHFDRLGLMEGVEVVVREPDAVSLAKGPSSLSLRQRGVLNHRN